MDNSSKRLLNWPYFLIFPLFYLTKKSRWGKIQKNLYLFCIFWCLSKLIFSKHILWWFYTWNIYLKERLLSVFMNIWTSSPSLGSLRTKASLKLPLEDVIVEKYPPGWGFPCIMVFPSSSIQIERISPNRDFRATFSLLQKVSKRKLITFILIILIY